MKKWTKTDSERQLNELGADPSDLKSNGGLVQDGCAYGSWLRRNDPIQFELYHNEQANHDNEPMGY